MALPRRRAIRQTSDATTHSTLTSLWETRRIRVAQGIQFHGTQIEQRIDAHANTTIEEHMGRYLRHRGVYGLTIDGAGNITCERPDQHVRYEVTFTDEKNDFKHMLETENLLAVYTGHARHGLGPCFGDSGNQIDQPFTARSPVPHRAPTESWFDGVSGRESVTGLFRMGRRYILMPVTDDVAPLGYSPRLVPYTMDSPLPRGDCDVDVLAHYSRLQGYALRELGITHGLHGTVDPDGLYWGTMARHGTSRQLQPHAVLEGAGTTPPPPRTTSGRRRSAAGRSSSSRAPGTATGTTSCARGGRGRPKATTRTCSIASGISPSPATGSTTSSRTL